MRCQDIPADVESTWENIKSGLLNTVEICCGWTKGARQRHKETWWWNEIVNDAVNEKRKAWKRWKNGSKEEYLKATRKTKITVYIAKRDAQPNRLPEPIITVTKKIFKLTKRLKRDNTEIVGEKFICNDEGKLALISS